MVYLLTRNNVMPYICTLERNQPLAHTLVHGLLRYLDTTMVQGNVPRGNFGFASIS